MNVIITGRHMELTENLKKYAEDKIKRFNKYSGNITEATVTLSVEKYRHKVEVLLKINGMQIQAESITGEMYSSIDDVVEKLEQQIRKYKEKTVSHRKNEEKTRTVPELMEQGAVDIKKRTFDVKPMSPEEAAMQMQLLDKNFFVFANASSGDINVMYKRRNGDLELIEPIR